jgi:hypothetical protein
MKNIKLLTLLVIAVLSTEHAFSQSCDSLASICKSYLNTPAKNDSKSVFISDGQTYRAFLDEDQTAEFTTTFYGGSTYRVAASAGTKDNYVIFEIYDKENHLLFSNIDYKNAPYWDFKVESTIDIRIEARLDSNKKSSGCTVLLIGFKQKNRK